MFNYLLTHSPLLYFTQSLWRDEAFSVLVAEKSPLFFIGKLSFEPPVYYLLLHYWMKLFGSSEIAIRSLSLLGFGLTTYVVIIWAEKIFKKHWLSWFLPVFFFFNPMLLYYAFEVRTYGWYMFFAILSLYAYATKNWKLYIPATILGFYTHTFMIVVPTAQLVHYLATTPKIFRLKTLLHDAFIRSLIIFGVAIAPWMMIVFRESIRLKQSWYYPVDIQLVVSALGNVFVGYEGTPWYGWRYTRLLSLIILGFSFYAIKQKKTRAFTSIFFCMIFVPLILVIGISFIKPIYVNRYVIPVTLAEIILLTLAIAAIKHTVIQKIIAGIFLVFVLAFNMWYPSHHPKLNIRSTLVQVNTLMTKNDFIFVESPLIFFETLYYSSDRSKVFLYNPNGNPFPWYVGDVIFPPHAMIRDLPSYPYRAFLIHKNGTFDIVYDTPISTIAKTRKQTR